MSQSITILMFHMKDRFLKLGWIESFQIAHCLSLVCRIKSFHYAICEISAIQIKLLFQVAMRPISPQCNGSCAEALWSLYRRWRFGVQVWWNWGKCVDWRWMVCYGPLQHSHCSVYLYFKLALNQDN